MHDARRSQKGVRVTPSAEAVAIIQARMGSERLPGKVMLPLAGVSAVAHLVARLRAATVPGTICLAIPALASDDGLAEWAAQADVLCVRGESEDVLARYVAAWTACGSPEWVWRITADAPILDAAILDALWATHRAHPNAGYIAEGPRKSYPLGIVPELFTGEAMRWAHAHSLPRWREHVTPALYADPSCPYAHAWMTPLDPPRERLRLTLDTREDYEVLAGVFERLYATDPCFTLTDVLADTAAHPDAYLANRHVIQRTVV